MIDVELIKNLGTIQNYNKLYSKYGVRFLFNPKKIIGDIFDGYLSYNFWDNIIYDCSFNIDNVNKIEKIYNVKRVIDLGKNNSSGDLLYEITNDEYDDIDIVVKPTTKYHGSIDKFKYDSHVRRIVIYNLNTQELLGYITQDLLSNLKFTYDGGYHFDSRPSYLCFNNKRYLYFRINNANHVRSVGVVSSDKTCYNFNNYKFVKFINCDHNCCYHMTTFKYKNNIYAIGHNYNLPNNPNGVKFKSEAIILFKMLTPEKFEQIKIIESSDNTRYNFYLLGFTPNQNKEYFFIKKENNILVYTIKEI